MADYNFDGLEEISQAEQNMTAPLRATMEQGVKSNPDNTAKIIELSKRTGVNPAIVKTKPEDFEQKEKLNALNFDDLVTSAPGTAKYLQDMDAASISHDDVPTLKKLEGAILKAFGNTLGTVVKASPLGTAINTNKAINQVNDVYDDGKLFEGFGAEKATQYGNTIDGWILRQLSQEHDAQSMHLNAALTDDPYIQEMLSKNNERSRPFREQQYLETLNNIRTRTKEAEGVTPKDLTTVQQGVRSGVSSAIDMGGAVAASVLTKTGQVGVLGAMGASVYGNSYADARAKGLADDDANMYAVLQSAIEVGTETLPLKTLTALATVPGGGKMLKNAINFMVQEGLTEQLATLGQTIVDYGYGLDEQLAKATTAEEMLDIQMQRQAVTAIATVVGGSIQTGAAVAVNTTAESLMSEEVKQQRTQAFEQMQIDELAKVATESKTKERSPTMMKRFLQQSVDGDKKVVYMDAVQTKLYLNSLGEDVVAADPTLQSLAERIQNNDAPNGDLTVPLTDFATDIVGNEHYEALRPHMKLSSNTETPFRQEAEGQQRVDYFKDMIAKAEANASQYTENKQMFDDVKAELIATGQITPKMADYYAQIVPAFVTVKADELGISPAEMYQQMGLKIKGPYAEREQALADGYVLEQDSSNQEDTPQFKTWAGTEEPIIEYSDINETEFRQDKPYVLRAFHGTTHDFNVFDSSIKGNKEGQFGAINYFTSSEYDANQNYLSTGPDITNAIESEAERLADEISTTYEEYNNDEDGVAAIKEQYGDDVYDEDMLTMARNIVRKTKVGDNEHIKELYIRTNKPFVVGGDNNPFMEFINYEEFDADARDSVAGSYGITVEELEANFEQYEDEVNEERYMLAEQAGDPLTEAIGEVAREYDLDEGQLQSDFYGVLSEGISHTELEERLRNNEAISYAEDPESGDLIGSHVLAAVIQKLGFDAIILKNANQRFKNMDMERGTTHIHIFDENNTQIKSDTDNSGAFNPNDANIYAQSPIKPTDKPAFKKWFGDSVVIDADGSPKVVYHGTVSSFEEFQKKEAGKTTQADNAGLGFFFTSSPSIAGIYPKMAGGVGGNIMPTYVSIKQPLVIEASTMKEADEILLAEFNDQYDGAVINVIGSNQTVYMVRESNQIKSATGNNGNFDPNSNSILEQGGRGYYDVNNVTIRLTEAADASTFLHEFAHFMLDMERKTSGRQMAPIIAWWSRNTESLAKEANVEESAVQAWLADTNSVTAEQAEAIDRATHEQFARGFEAYIMEGKAPSVELRNAFRVFARLLKAVYDAVRSRFNAPNIDTEMRQVFDRLLATEEQIVAEEARSRYEPLFTDAAMAGMTDEAYAEYINRNKQVSDKSKETVRDKLMRQLMRTHKAWWNRELEDRMVDKMFNLSKEQVYAARERMVSDETFRMDRVAVKDLLGVETIPPELRNMTITGKRGGMPDDVAASFGYGSGAEMIKDIMEARPIKEVAREQAEADMIEEHGDIMNDGTLEQIVQDAVRNDERAEIILTEIKQLAANAPTIDKQTLKYLAATQIGKRSLLEIRPDRYRKAEIRSAQEAAVAMKEGRKEDALRAKTQQLMNMYLWQEAMAAREMGERVTKHMARFRKKTVRERIGKAGNGYLDNILSILDRFEFRKSISVKKAQENAQSIQSWLQNRTEDGDNIVLSTEVLDEKYGRHWKELPVNELTGIYESVLSIEHNANSANNINVAEDQLTFEQAIQRGLDSMAKVKNKFSSQRTDVIDEKNPVRRFIAEQTKIPLLTSWLDGGERVGVMHDLIMDPMNKALNTEQDLWQKVGKKVVDALMNRSKEARKRHAKKIYIPELVTDATDMHTGHDGNLYGHQILAVALNTGNQGNLTKMLVGEGWATQDDISMDNPQLQAVLKHMTREDWDLVQAIWNEVDQLYPLLADVHERTSGLPLAKVEATPVETPYGTYSGGYYPVKYDANRSQKAAENEQKSNEQAMSMFNSAGMMLPSVSTGARIDRTGYTGPIKLSLEVVQDHLHEVIHFISHYEAVRQVYKVIKDPRIAEAITAKMGKEEYNLLKPWLNDVAKDGRSSQSKLQMESWLGRLRNGVTLGVMGFKASTILIQGSGIFNTMAETGSANVMRAMRSIMASDKTMKEAYDYAFEHSKVMKFRMQTMDRELGHVLNSIEGKNTLLAKAQQASMMGIALMQTYTVDVASWYAGYIKGMKDFEGDQKRAFKYADWVVENAQGSGNTKDMAAIMRNKNEAWRLFTMFMTFFSSLGNMVRDTTRGARSGQYSIGTVAAKAMFMFMLPSIYEAIMREGIPDPDDDDEMESFVEKVTFNAVMMPMGTQPVIRDIANGVGSGFGYNASPVTATLGKGVESSAAMITRLAEDDELTQAQIKNFSRLVAAWYGVPGVNQAWASGEHIYQVLEDGEDYSTRQLLFGPDRD